MAMFSFEYKNCKKYFSLEQKDDKIQYREHKRPDGSDLDKWPVDFDIEKASQESALYKFLDSEKSKFCQLVNDKLAREQNAETLMTYCASVLKAVLVSA